MVVAKLQWAAGVVAVCGMLTVGGVWATGQGPGPGGPGAPRGPWRTRKNEARLERKASTSQHRRA